MRGNRRVGWKRGPMIRPVVLGLSVLALLLAAEAVAQERSTWSPQPLPPLADPGDPNAPAKELFARKSEPAHLVARAIGNYAGGCLAGAVALPISGETWQVMRLSRNRAECTADPTYSRAAEGWCAPYEARTRSSRVDKVSELLLSHQKAGFNHRDCSTRSSAQLHYRPRPRRENSPCQPGAIHTWHICEVAR